MKIIIQNLSLDFSLESENNSSPSIETHNLKEQIKNLEGINAEKEKEIAELRAICDAPLPLEIQGYLEEIGNLNTELRDAKYQIETLKSMLNASPSPVAEAPEATTTTTAHTPVAEAPEATIHKRKIMCICKVCGKAFDANHNRVQFCSDECRSSYKTKKATGSVSKKTKICAECGAEFSPTSNVQKRCPECGIKKKSRKRNSVPTKPPKK